MSITNISKGNKALKFIEERILDDKYRGSWSSQHNRYTMEQIVCILELLYRFTPKESLMQIRTTDISKRPKNTSEEFIYAQFCNEYKKKANNGSQDAMRKNLFVDMHRMGLIIRYDKNKNPTNPFSRQSIKYVCISKQGLKLINAKNILDKYFIFSKGIDILLSGRINIILNILRDIEHDIDKINIYEYMFFVSAIDTETSFNISFDKAIDLIKEYRVLTSIQQRAVIETLKTELKPKNYSGSKTSKRDFHNWHNKIAQIYYLLNQTVYFETREEYLVLKVGKNSFDDTNDKTKLNRSISEKNKYLEKHDVKKKIGFELHHVVPLAWSESIYHFKMIDKWENLVYIDAFSHAKITQNANKNVVLSIVNNKDIVLSDYNNNEVYIKYKENILYKLENSTLMKQYNEKLREINIF